MSEYTVANFATMIIRNHSHTTHFATTSLMNADLPVNVNASLNCKLGNKHRTVAVEGVATVDRPAFRHAGAVVIFEVPPAYCNSV